MHKFKKILPFIIGIAIPLALGGLSAALTMGDMKDYADILKPPLSPPAILFPIVWTILYALMGIGAARVARTGVSRDRSHALLLFGLQLIFNFCWSIFFFELHAYGFAFFWLIALWTLILAMTLTFRKVDAPAAALQIPYLAWVAFAGYLNFGVWLLNR